MTIQYRMLMMADQSSEHDTSQTPSLWIMHTSERAKVWFPSYQDICQLFIAQFVETRLCKLGWHWATDLLFVQIGSHAWWCESQANHVQRMRDTDFHIQDGVLSWMKLIEGDDHRLTKAVFHLLNQSYNGHLMLPWTLGWHLLSLF